MLMLTLVIIASLLTAYFIIIYWLRIYNLLQRLLTQAQNNYANIPVIKQKRLDNIYALSQIADKYHLHEYETMKDTIKARGYNAEQRIVGLNAVLEKYPELKADSVFMSLMDRNSQIETQLNQARMFYNKSVESYNETLRQFPQNIIANFHGFRELTYLKITPETYTPKTIFSN